MMAVVNAPCWDSGVAGVALGGLELLNAKKRSHVVSLSECLDLNHVGKIILVASKMIKLLLANLHNANL